MAHGNDVVLKCFANGGTPPLSYKWAKISGQAHPYRAGSYLSQHTFQSELSYQESFHSSVNQGAGAPGQEGGVGAGGQDAGTHRGFSRSSVASSQTQHPCGTCLL